MTVEIRTVRKRVVLPCSDWFREREWLKVFDGQVLLTNAEYLKVGA